MKTFYAKNTINSENAQGGAIFINNCGYYASLGVDLPTKRPMGRKDYHLITALSGRITVGDEEITRGEFYLYFPFSPQQYVYKAGENSKYLWLHFTGSEVEELICKLKIKEGKIKPSESGLVEELFLKIINYYMQGGKHADEFGSGLIKSMMTLLSEEEVKSPLYKAEIMLSDIDRGYSVEEIAKVYDMSVEHFIRLFKKHFKVTPLRYRITKQIEKAKFMLTETNFGIFETAEQSGFKDGLYFSRVFKKYVGISPSDYRRLNKNY